MSDAIDWTEQARRLMGQLSGLLAERPPAAEHGGADCRWCPLCQAAAVVRGERPEVTAALADVLTAAAAALRTFAEAGPIPQEPEVQEPQDGEAPAVQQIDIA